MVIEELIALLGFELKGEDAVQRFKAGLRDVVSAATDTVSVVGRVAGRFALLSGGLLATAGIIKGVVAGAVRSLRLFVDPVAKEFDDLLELSDRIGASFEELQQWGYAAQTVGGNAVTMGKTLENMERRMVMLQRGSGGAKKALEQYGITIGKTESATDLLLRLSDRFQKMTTGQRNDISRALGIDKPTQNLLIEGRKRIQQLIKQKKEIGVVDRASAEAASAYTDTIIALNEIYKTLKDQIILGVLPAVHDFLLEMKDWIFANKDLIRSNLTGFLRAIVSGLRTLNSIAGGVIRVFGLLSNAFERVTGIGLEGQLKLLAGAAALVFAAFHPWIALFTGIVLVIDDLRAFFQGENSITGLILEWVKANQQIQTLVGWWDALVESIKRATMAIREFFGVRDATEAEAKARRAADPERQSTHSGNFFAGRGEPMKGVFDVSPKPQPQEEETDKGWFSGMMESIKGAIESVANAVGMVKQPEFAGVEQSYFSEFNVNAPISITQNVTGATAPEAAGAAVRDGVTQATRRASDIANQGPTLDSLRNYRTPTGSF